MTTEEQEGSVPVEQPDLSPPGMRGRTHRVVLAFAGAMMMLSLAVSAFEEGSTVIGVLALLGILVVVRRTLSRPSDSEYSDEDLRVWHQLRDGRGVDLFDHAQRIPRADALLRIEDARALMDRSGRHHWSTFALMAVAVVGVVGWTTYDRLSSGFPLEWILVATAISLPVFGLSIFGMIYGTRREARMRAGLEAQLEAVTAWEGEEIPRGALEGVLDGAVEGTGEDG